MLEKPTLPAEQREGKAKFLVLSFVAFYIGGATPALGYAEGYGPPDVQLYEVEKRKPISQEHNGRHGGCACVGRGGLALYFARMACKRLGVMSGS